MRPEMSGTLTRLPLAPIPRPVRGPHPADPSEVVDVVAIPPPPVVTHPLPRKLSSHLWILPRAVVLPVAAAAVAAVKPRLLLLTLLPTWVRKRRNCRGPHATEWRVVPSVVPSVVVATIELTHTCDTLFPPRLSFSPCV